MRKGLIWLGLATVLLVPVVLSLTSPLLAWRTPVYIAAGLAGVIAFALMPLQPLLAVGLLPGLNVAAARRMHRWMGAALVLAVLLHVAGLWITSPPDVVDALLLRSPTPFSDWGVVAMWALFVTGVLALLRAPLQIRWRIWRLCHTALFAVIVVGTVIHALLIEGTMETVSKSLLAALLGAVTLWAVVRLRVWTMLKHRR